jgi:hypothetical protein
VILAQALVVLPRILDKISRQTLKGWIQAQLIAGVLLIVLAGGQPFFPVGLTALHLILLFVNTRSKRESILQLPVLWWLLNTLHALLGSHLWQGRLFRAAHLDLVKDYVLFFYCIIYFARTQL